MTVVFLGPQGSGKGTQATLLGGKHGLIHIEIGRMLRATTRKRSAFAKRVARYIDHGQLVPFSWVLRLFEQQLREHPRRAGIMLDGTPRRLSEAKALLRILEQKFGRTVDHVFYLTIPRKEAVRRLAKRWVCEANGHSLTMGTNVHAPQSLCPHDGSPIFQREDDTPKAIAKRLQLFARETKPVIAYFRHRGVLTTIDGRKSIPSVFREVDRIYQHSVLNNAQRNRR